MTTSFFRSIPRSTQRSASGRAASHFSERSPRLILPRHAFWYVPNISSCFLDQSDLPHDRVEHSPVRQTTRSSLASQISPTPPQDGFRARTPPSSPPLRRGRVAPPSSPPLSEPNVRSSLPQRLSQSFAAPEYRRLPNRHHTSVSNSYLPFPWRDRPDTVMNLVVRPTLGTRSFSFNSAARRVPVMDFADSPSTRPSAPNSADGLEANSRPRSRSTTLPTSGGRPIAIFSKSASPGKRR